MWSKIKKFFSYIIPPVISVGLCFVLYRGLDFRTLGEGLRECSPWLGALFVAVSVLAMVFRGLRWRLQLRVSGINPGFGVMSRSIFGTFAVNLVFPRLGEFWRCAYIARISGTEFSPVFGSMVADRLADTLMAALIAFITFICFSPAMAEFLEQASIPAGFLSGRLFWAFVAVMVVGSLYVVFAKDKFAEKIREFVRKMWGGFISIFRMKNKGLWLLLTLGIWGSYVASMALSMAAYPPTAHLGADAVMLTFVFGSLAMAIPSNGGIGPWQFAVVLALNGLFDVPSSTALIFATLNLGANTLLNILLGLYTFGHIALKKD